MNQPDPISTWRGNPTAAATNAKGWTVEFAVDLSFTIASLDYAEGKDVESSTKHPFTAKQLRTLEGYVKMIQLESPRALHHGTQFKTFLDQDAVDGMCELRFGATEGHRLLCFQRAGQRFVIACGFVKPRQAETPPEHKARARTILAAHEKRKADLEKAAKAKGNQRHGR